MGTTRTEIVNCLLRQPTFYLFAIPFIYGRVAITVCKDLHLHLQLSSEMNYM